MATRGIITLVLLFLFLGLAATSVHGRGLRPGFYSRTCPRFESIVRSAMVRGFNANPRIAPGLLRLHFHDCFVRGCDGSVLINGTTNERDAPPNINIQGYNVIDDAKTRLEAACPGVVSCADILAIAARDSVVLTRGISWVVPTGRRDGRVSIRSEALNLPGANETISSQVSKLANIGLNTQDLVTLVGSHTIGTTSCAVIISRLFNFTNRTATGADPTIDPTFLQTLRSICPQNGDRRRRLFLDTGSGTTFDLSYFINLSKNRGVLPSDRFLWNDPATQPIVIQFLNGKLNFAREFGRSMVKMGNVNVLTGTNGEIRRVCSVIN